MRLYHYLEAKWALDDIKNRRLKISKVDDLNDPYEYECVRSYDPRLQQAFDDTKLFMTEAVGIVCFSQSWNNLLMWSHYGEKHRGMCLGFDVPDDRAKPVTYISDVRTVGKSEVDSPKEKRKIVDLLTAAKYDGWGYEAEVRIYPPRVEPDEGTHLYFLPFSNTLKLKEVIAGANCQLGRASIETAIAGYPEPVQIVKAKRAVNRFEIIVDVQGFPPPSHNSAGM